MSHYKLLTPCLQETICSNCVCLCPWGSRHLKQTTNVCTHTHTLVLCSSALFISPFSLNTVAMRFVGGRGAGSSVFSCLFSSFSSCFGSCFLSSGFSSHFSLTRSRLKKFSVGRVLLWKTQSKISRIKQLALINTSSHLRRRNTRWDSFDLSLTSGRSLSNGVANIIFDFAKKKRICSEKMKTGHYPAPPEGAESTIYMFFFGINSRHC